VRGKDRVDGDPFNKAGRRLEGENGGESSAEKEREGGDEGVARLCEILTVSRRLKRSERLQ
jgi:hypothetical protein